MTTTTECTTMSKGIQKILSITLLICASASKYQENLRDSQLTDLIGLVTRVHVVSTEMTTIPQVPNDIEVSALQGVLPALPMPCAPKILSKLIVRSRRGRRDRTLLYYRPLDPFRPKRLKFVVSTDLRLGEDAKMKFAAEDCVPDDLELTGHGG
jgi:hypothetical protein